MSEIPREKRPHKWMLWHIYLLWLLFNLATAAIVTALKPLGRFQIVDPLLVGILGAQLSILGGWLTLGRGSLFIRWLVVWLAASAILVSGIFPQHPSAIIGIGIVSLFVAPALLLLFAFPYYLISLQEHELVMSDKPMLADTEKQLTIRQLIGLTSMAAAMFALVRWSIESDFAPLAYLIEALLLLWALPTVSVLGVLGTRIHPLGTLALAMLIYCFALPMTAEDRSDSATYLAAIFSGCAWYATHLLVLRWQGYRIIPIRWVKRSLPTTLDTIE